MEGERTPPSKIRVTGLQEAQLRTLVEIDEQCARLLLEVGVTATARDEHELARLRTRHNVFVAEADHAPAGYAAWRDDPPGVACLAIMNVAPAYQRFRIGERLLREIGQDVRRVGLDHVVVSCAQKAAAAMAFLRSAGFQAVTGASPAKVQEWRELNAESADAAAPEHTVLWRNAQGLGIRVLPGVPTPDPEE